MHSSVTITDSIYGGLTSADVRRVIGGLQEEKKSENDGAIKAAAAILEVLQNNPDALRALIGNGK